MQSKRLKFIGVENNESEYLNFTNSISQNDSPFKELLKGENLDSFSLIINDFEEYKISLKETIDLLINVKGVGSFHFFFLSKFFNKSLTLTDLAAIKNIENPKEKVDVLFKVLDRRNPLFVIYLPKGNNALNISDFDYQESVFFVNDYFEEEVVEEVAPKVEEPKKPSAVKSFFAPLAEDLSTLFFIIVSSMIIFFTVSAGTYNYKDDNNIYIFFFAFALVGFVFNFIIFKDYAKKGLKKFNEYLFVILAIGIGLAISIGLFSLYYSYATQNKEEITITSNSVILPSIFIYLGLELVSVVAGKLLSLKRKA